MLSEIEQFVNWVRRRSPAARTWKDYGYDLRFFMQVVGDVPLKEITFRLANIKITAHRLRHSFANNLLNADAPITSIQKLMGHRWIESTQNYVMANDKQVCKDYYAACEQIESWAG
jgi:integrase